MTIHSAAVAARDDGIRRLRHLNRAVIAGSVVLIGAFSDAAANAIPGHTVARTAAKTTATHPAATHHRHKAAAATPTASASDSGSGQSSASSTSQQQTPDVSQAPAVYQPPAPQQQLAPPPAPPVITQAPAQTVSGGS